MDIYCSVEGQKLTIETPLRHYAQYSDDFVRFLFRFSSDWDGLMTFAQFRQGDKASEEYLSDVTVTEGDATVSYKAATLPNWLQPGRASMLLLGTGRETVIGTTNHVVLKIDPTGYCGFAKTSDIDETLYQQLINRFIQLESIVGGISRRTSDATKDSKGIVQAGDGLSVENGILDVDLSVIASKTYADTKAQAAQTAAETHADVKTQAAQTAAETYADVKAQAAQTAAEAYTNEKAQALRSLIGTPLSAATHADMTDHTKIYVYVGSETGYVAGNWYYWDGSSWVSGGVYNSTALETDKSLSVEDMAADAKTVGGHLSNISDLTQNYIGNKINLASRCFRGGLVVCADSDLQDFGNTKGDDAGYTVTEHIDIADFDYLDIVVSKTSSSYTFVGIVFYDESFNPIDGFTYANTETANELKRFEIQNNYKYVRTTFRNDSQYLPFFAVGYKKTNYEKLIKSVGSLDAYIDNNGEIQSSALTKTFYAAATKGAIYKLKVFATRRDLLSFAEFDDVPVIGAESNNFSVTNQNNEVSLTSASDNGYIAWSFVENKSDDVFFLNLLFFEYAKSIGTISDLVNNHIILPDAYSPSVDQDAKKIQGYVIDESGNVIENSSGYYIDGIDVVEKTQYFIDVDSTNTNLTNTRVHGYYNGEWVAQIYLLQKENTTHVSGSFIVPTGIDSIKISTSRTETISIKRKYYLDYALMDLMDKFDVSKKTVNMGNPFIYLSDEIPDEILDSATVDDVYAIYDALVANYPQFVSRLSDIGNDESGLPMRLYRIGWQNPWLVGTGHEASWDQEDNMYDSSYDYQKLFVNAGTHGNEKSSVFGVALSIKEIVESNEPWAQYLRGNFIIDVCPVANPWGFNNTSRKGYGNVDINRNFLIRTRSETKALYNLVSNGNYHAYIDSHNSGGNANYFGITSTNPRLKTYVQMNMKLAGIVYNSWKNLAYGDQYAVDPYMMCWTSDPVGMFQDMMNELNIPGYLIESVGVYKSGMGTLTPNHKRYCKFTKDLLINSLIALGSTDWTDINGNK